MTTLSLPKLVAGAAPDTSFKLRFIAEVALVVPTLALVDGTAPRAELDPVSNSGPTLFAMQENDASDDDEPPCVVVDLQTAFSDEEFARMRAYSRTLPDEPA